MTSVTTLRQRREVAKTFALSTEVILGVDEVDLAWLIARFAATRVILPEEKGVSQF